MKNLIIASLLIGTSFLGFNQDFINDASEISINNFVEGITKENFPENSYVTSIQSYYKGADGSRDTMNIRIGYDTDKRVVSLKDLSIGGNSFSYFYSEAARQPYLSVCSNGIYLQKTFHYYDEKGRVVKDSAVISSSETTPGTKLMISTTIQKYEYQHHKIIGNRITAIEGDAIYTTDTAITDSKGNILVNKKYRHDGSSFVLDVTSVFSYDGHPSPFAGKSNFMAHQSFPIGQSSYFEKFFPENVVVQKESVENGFSYNEQNSFTYTSPGYPATMTTINAGDTTKSIYHYAAL